MNIASRLIRYASAWSDLDKIRNLTRDNYSVEEIVDQVFTLGGGFFAPIQIREEIIGALKTVEAIRPKFIVEIGTAGGGTMLLWSRVAHPEATIVTIDLPGGDFGGGSSILRMPLFRRLGLPGQKLHFLRADSHSPDTLRRTQEFLQGNEADFLFIDADHTEAGVRTDYTMYSDLVRQGGIIAFHDIGITRPEYGVRKLWHELAGYHQVVEFKGQPLTYGLGLLYHAPRAMRLAA